MKLKKLLTLSLACALCVGATFSVSAAGLDFAWYAKQNPDVVAALGDSPEALQLHYEMFGRKEGRMANTHDVEAQLRRLFDAEEYAAFYPDVKNAFGNDAEAMFQHYISFGMLEGRRPCEEVSGQAAVSLKETVASKMKEAGLDATPGSVQLVEIITGSISEDVGGAVVQQALTAVSGEVEKAVAGTIEEANAPEPVEEGSNEDSGSSAPVESAPAPTAKPTAVPTTEPTAVPTTEPTAAPTTEPTASPEPEYTAAADVYNVTVADGKMNKGSKVASVTSFTGDGTESSPYSASVTGIGKDAHTDTGYWFAVALSKPEGENLQHWLKVGGTWYNVTDNKKGGADWTGVLTDKIVFAVSDDGSGGDVDFCISAETSVNGTAAPATGTFYRVNVAFAEDTPAPIKVYKQVTVTDKSITALGTGTDCDVTGEGTDGSPYTAEVGGVKKVEMTGSDGSKSYWFAVALPAASTQQYWIKIGSDWTNVTSNAMTVSDGSGLTGYMVYAVGLGADEIDKVSVVELCISSDTTNLSNGTYYKLNVAALTD